MLRIHKCRARKVEQRREMSEVMEEDSREEETADLVARKWAVGEEARQVHHRRPRRRVSKSKDSRR